MLKMRYSAALTLTLSQRERESTAPILSQRERESIALSPDFGPARLIRHFS